MSCYQSLHGLPGEVYKLLINYSPHVLGLIQLFHSCRWIEVGHPTEGGDPETGIGRGDQSTTHIGVPPTISTGDLVIRETTKTEVAQPTTSEEGHVIMIHLALKGHMTMTAIAEDMNAKVMTLISLHMTARCYPQHCTTKEEDESVKVILMDIYSELRVEVIRASVNHPENRRRPFDKGILL